MSLGHPCCTNGNNLLTLSRQVCCPCYCLAGARKGAIEKYRGSVPTPPGSLDADYGNRASNACEEQYRRKARQSSRLSLKPEPSSCQSRRRRHRVRCEARKAEEAPRRNCRPQNGELRRGLPPLAPRPTEVRGMIRPTRIPSTLTPGEAQTALAARPTHYTQAHHGGLWYGRTAWPTGETGICGNLAHKGSLNRLISTGLSSGWGR